jgi:GT2 family glycosyltransferase
VRQLSVIIPSRTITNLRACVEAVKAHDDCRVIVVWDRTNGNTWLPPTADYSVREVDQRFVYARNCNYGIVAAGDDDVILLNDDALLRTAGGFSELQKLAQVHPGFGIIGAVTNVTGQLLQKPHGVGLREVPHFAFVCVLIPRRTINTIGLLDERYCIDYGVEDRDYCEAVKRVGLKCGVFDHCFVDHASLTSSFRGKPHASRSFQKNWSLFCQKWGVPA